LASGESSRPRGAIFVIGLFIVFALTGMARRRGCPLFRRSGSPGGAGGGKSRLRSASRRREGRLKVSIDRPAWRLGCEIAASLQDRRGICARRGVPSVGLRRGRHAVWSWGIAIFELLKDVSSDLTQELRGQRRELVRPTDGRIDSIVDWLLDSFGPASVPIVCLAPPRRHARRASSVVFWDRRLSIVRRIGGGWGISQVWSVVWVLRPWRGGASMALARHGPGGGQSGVILRQGLSQRDMTMRGWLI